MYHNEKSKTDLSALYLVYKTRSCNETPGFRGICHHVEHVLCEKLKDLEDAMTIDGIDYNAYTDDNEVVFYMSGLERKMKKWRKKFINNILGYTPTEEVIDREREIVCEEYKQMLADPLSRHYCNMNRKYYNSYGAIGEIGDIKTFSAEKVLKYIKNNFNKPSCIISISKDFIFNEKFMNIDFDTSPKCKTYHSQFNDYLVLEKGSNPDEQSNYGLISKEKIEANQPYIKFINLMLSMGLNAPFMQELREKRKLTYGVQAVGINLNGSGINVMIMPTSTSKLIESEKTFKYVLNNPSKFMTKDRFNMTKEYLIVRDETKKWSTNNINKFIIEKDWIINPKKYDYDVMMDFYNKYFKFNKFNVCIDTEEFK